MRLFKRQNSDTSPQLVSATPISQDGAVPLADRDENADGIAKKEKDCESRTSVKEDVNDSQKSTSSCVSNRKGISTWGRKVGRRWDQLKRSDSSELLSVSGRRRRWSPNRKSCGDVVDEKENGTGGPAELPKPKRISRVESLRNLFRSSERNNNFLSSDMSSRNVTIQEEDVPCISHYPMEKALSDGALKNVPFLLSSDDSRGTLLHEKKKQLSRSIQDLQEQQRVLDYILKNQEMLKTQEGSAFARETLHKVRTSVSPKRRGSQSETNKNSVSTQTREFFSSHLNNIKRNLFNARPSTNECERNDVQRCATTGLEDLMNNLRIGCDESGYDSDSTRAGADSPDSGKSVPQMLKPRSFSITSDDYHGVDLSLPVSTPKKKDAATETTESVATPSCLDDTVILDKHLHNASISTVTTALISDDEDTDSCDEETFKGFAEFEMSFADDFSKVDASSLLKCDSGLSKVANDFSQTDASSLSKCDSGLSKVANSKTVGKLKQSSSECTEVNRPMVKNSLVKLDNTLPLSTAGKPATPQIPLNATKWHVNSSVLNLLDNAASPCKDSPPATKICAKAINSPLQYYTPKRARSKPEFEEFERTNSGNKIKRSVQVTKSERQTSAAAKTLVRRELKTMKLTVVKLGSLGISVERREAARPFYVISKMDANGVAAKSKQFRIGDEIVRICGRRLRGMSITEARNALRNCVGSVELQIAREPTFTFGEELGDTWGDTLVRTRSDSEVWTLKDARKNATLPSGDSTMSQEDRQSSCKIVGALMKDGKNLSVSSMDRMESESEKKESDQKMTGMRKFQVKKRCSNPIACSRRATSLSMDLLTITLEKGAAKKLGFSIVGGSDSNKGSMGIFVKDIMAGGQAAEEGTLRVGDEILAINGVSMDGLTHAKALQTFKAAKAGKMIIHVGRRDPTHKRLCNKR